MAQTIRAPANLSKEAQRWWRKLQGEYGICDEGGLFLLQVAFEAFDRMRAAQAEIARDGQLIEDRFQQRKPHPLLPAEAKARDQLLQALRQLNLDVEPLHAHPGRPGA